MPAGGLRQHAMDGTHTAVESKFAEQGEVAETYLLDLLGGDEDAERDGQVEGRSFFSAICRGEDDGDSAARPG